MTEHEILEEILEVLKRIEGFVGLNKQYFPAKDQDIYLPPGYTPLYVVNKPKYDGLGYDESLRGDGSRLSS